MKKLLLLLFSLFSSAVCAMDVAPAAVAMGDGAPSHFSKQTHQRCCGLCCGAVVITAIEWFTWNNAKLHWRYCAVPGNKCTAGRQALMGLSEGILAAEGAKIGRQVGVVTHKLDQSLKAMIDSRKEKSE